MAWRSLGLVGLLVLGFAGGAAAQTSCTPQTQAQFLANFSDNATRSSITPQTMRNLVCSVPLAGQTITTNNSPLVVSIPGVFVAGQMNTPFEFISNGLNPLSFYQSSHPGAYATHGLTVGVVVPSNAETNETNGIASYVSNGGSAHGATAGSFFLNNTVAGATGYGLNIDVGDNNNISTVIGAEFDMGATNASSTAYGNLMIGVFPNGSPPVAIAYQVSALNSPWGAGFNTTDGGSALYGIVGALGTAANSDGQGIKFNSYDSGAVVRQCQINAVHGTATGNLSFTCPSGGDFSFFNQINVTGNIQFVGGSFAILGLNTVSQLPTCNGTTEGAIAFATDLTAPTYGAAAVGGGTVKRPVFCDGSGWKT